MSTGGPAARQRAPAESAAGGDPPCWEGRVVVDHRDLPRRPPVARPKPRSTLRTVVIPVEHGGWGLTVEPVLLGLLVEPTVAGLAIGLAAVVAFLARTPLKVVLVDAHRHRHLDRTVVARRVLAFECLVLVTLVSIAARGAEPGSWWPLLVAAPLLGVQLSFDMRSRSRRLVPELAGAVGIGGVATLIALAGGSGRVLAVGLWMVLAARALSAIVTVRDQVGRLHGRPGHPRHLLMADVGATAVAVGAVVLEPSMAAGAAAVLIAVTVQRVLGRAPTPRPVILGLRQTALGLFVVVAAAAGVIAG